MHHILTSGRAGTKSSEAAIKAVYKIISEDSCSVIIVRKFHNKLKKTVYKEVLRAIKRLGLSKSTFKITTAPMEIKYKKNGNTIYFTGSDSIDDTKGIIDENHPIKLVVIDEATEFFEKGEGEDEDEGGNAASDEAKEGPPAAAAASDESDVAAVEEQSNDGVPNACHVPAMFAAWIPA